MNDRIKRIKSKTSLEIEYTEYTFHFFIDYSLYNNWGFIKLSIGEGYLFNTLKKKYSKFVTYLANPNWIQMIESIGSRLTIQTKYAKWTEIP